MFPRNGFSRGVVVLIGGNVGAQGLTILLAPVLTRLYQPHDFGLLATYAGLLAVWSVVASLRYELAIPLPKHDGHAANLVLLCLVLVAVSTLLSALFVWGFRDLIAKAFGVPHLAPLLWMLPVGTFLGGAYKALNYWAVRREGFQIIAVTQLSQSLGKASLQLVGFPLGAANLIFAQTLSQAIGAGRLGRTFVASIQRSDLSWSQVKGVARRYRRFPIYSSGEGLLNTAGLQLPPLLFAALFSPAAAGLYSLANQVLSLPMSLVGNAVGQVFFSRASQAHRDGTLANLVVQLHKRLAHFGLPPALLLMFAGPDLFAFCFGVEWRQAGEFARWMAPWLYFVFVASPLSTLFAVAEQQVQGFAYQIVLIVSRVLAIGIGAYIFDDILVTVALFAGASAFCWVALLFWLALLCKSPAEAMLVPTVWAASIGLLCVLPFVLFSHLGREIPNAWLWGLATSASLIVARYLYMLRRAQ